MLMGAPCLLLRSSGGYSSGDYASDRGCGYASCSSDGDGLSSEAKSLKRQKFEQHRKQHYNMRNALQKCVLMLQVVMFCGATLEIQICIFMFVQGQGAGQKGAGRV